MCARIEDQGTGDLPASGDAGRYAVMDDLVPTEPRVIGLIRTRVCRYGTETDEGEDGEAPSHGLSESSGRTKVRTS